MGWGGRGSELPLYCWSQASWGEVFPQSPSVPEVEISLLFKIIRVMQMSDWDSLCFPDCVFLALVCLCLNPVVDNSCLVYLEVND